MLATPVDPMYGKCIQKGDMNALREWEGGDAFSSVNEGP